MALVSVDGGGLYWNRHPGDDLIAQKHPQPIAAVACISPAVWQTYAEARAANPGAFASAEDFANDEVIEHTSLTFLSDHLATG